MKTEASQPEGRYLKIGRLNFPTNRRGMKEVLLGTTVFDSEKRIDTSFLLFITGLIMADKGNPAVQSFGSLLFYAGLPSGLIQTGVAFSRREKLKAAIREAKIVEREAAIFKLENQVRKLSQPLLENTEDMLTLYDERKNPLPETTVTRASLSSNALASGEQYLSLMITELPKTTSSGNIGTIVEFSFPQVELMQIRSHVKDRQSGSIETIRFLTDVLGKVEALTTVAEPGLDLS